LFRNVHAALVRSSASFRFISQRSPNRKRVRTAVDMAATKLNVKVSHRIAVPPVPERLSPTSEGTIIDEMVATSRNL